MKISLDWLRDLVDWPGEADELAARLTMAGLNVEGIEEVRQTFPGVVVGRVLERRPHPDADRLSLCDVHDGEQTVRVVCGAPNVAAGQHVLLARVGAVLPGGVRIRKARIRGQDSAGMICSETELGLGEDAAGIMVLEGDPAPGTPADEIYGYVDVVLDIEVTPNRPDWLSHLGVAREVAAIFETKARQPALAALPGKGGEGLEFGVEIEDFGDCPRYTAHGARDLRLGPSPRRMQNRLRAVGARPINNVVDITNYVMFELGQPLHAFDRERLTGSRLLVRRAAAAETVRTLDGQERRLEASDLVIADTAGVVALAGVMGAERSEVAAGTTSIILESAFFAPRLVRRTSRRLGLLSESSYRFEREADWEMVERAALRALHLLQEHAGARILPDRVDRQDPDRKGRPDIPLRVGQVNRLLGVSLEPGQAGALLQRLGLKVAPLGRASDRGRGGATFTVSVPSFRRDLLEEVDLIEEIARLHGYDKLAIAGRQRGVPGVARRPLDRVLGAARRHLASSGYTELVTSNFMGLKDLDRLGLPEGDPRRRTREVLKPHHGGQTLLRTSLLPSLLAVVRRNVNADQELPLRLFQQGKVFLPRLEPPPEILHPGEESLPREPRLLQVAVAGRGEADLGGLPAGLREIRGVVEVLADLLRQPLSLRPEDCEPYLGPGRQWRLLDAAGAPVGTAGEVAAPVLAAYELEVPVAVAELDLGRLDLCPEPVRYRPFGRFPPVKRDLSLLVPQGVAWAAIADLVRARAGSDLRDLEVFDLYTGSGIPAGTAALGIRLKFRSAKGSLRGDTVDGAIADVVKALSEELGVRLRA